MAEITECNVCYRKFVIVEPKMLPCQHTYCLECLRSMCNERTIRCPECRASHRVPPNGVGGFPNNLAIVRLLSSHSTLGSLHSVPHRASSHHVKNMPCRNCKSGRNIQELCEHCDQYLCGACLKDHLRLGTEAWEADLAKLKDLNSTIKKELEEMTRREKKVEYLERQIKKWEKKCVEEVYSRTRSMMADVTSRINIDKILKEEAQRTSTEITTFENNFRQLTEAAKKSTVLQGNKSLKILIERSKSVTVAMSKKLQETMPQLMFDSKDAENVPRFIKKVKGVREMAEDEIKKIAEEQLPELVCRRDVFVRSRNVARGLQREKLDKVIKRYDEAVDSCNAGIPADIDELPSNPSEMNDSCSII